jgi:RIO kinase 1
MSGKHATKITDIEEMFVDYEIRNVSNRERQNADKKRFLKPKSASSVKSRIEIEAERSLISTDLTYQASHHERIWINDSLSNFFDQQWLDDILRLVQGGKEANVYLALANPSVPGLDKPYLAAKVYRPRRFRSLKKDHMYREGRVDLDSDGNVITEDGMLHAMSKKTEYGRELLHKSWIEHEVKTLQILDDAGADVPRVYSSGPNAILMTYVGDADTAAPVLYGLRLKQTEAHRIYERVLRNIDLMLSNHRVHGDFSAFNILYWEGDITIIDFPQAIDPRINRNAFRIFSRDVRRICEYFIRQGVSCDPERLALQMWKRHGYRIEPEIHPALLDAEDPRDRSIWRKQHRER